MVTVRLFLFSNYLWQVFISRRAWLRRYSSRQGSGRDSENWLRVYWHSTPGQVLTRPCKLVLLHCYQTHCVRKSRGDYAERKKRVQWQQMS